MTLNGALLPCKWQSGYYLGIPRVYESYTGVYKPVGFRVPPGDPSMLHLKPETGLWLAGNE